MLITCKCLNVSIDAKNSQNDLLSVDVATLNLSQTEELESFFKEELKEIEISQVTKQVKSLVQTKTAGHWVIEYCLNCSTNCYSTCSGKSTALVNASLITDTDVVSRMKTYKDYSPVFRIIVKPIVTENNTEGSELRQTPQKLQTSLTSLQQQLNEAIREQVTKTEERIRLFTEQLYSQLDEFRERATKDHRALAQKIYDAQPRLDKEIFGSLSGEIESTPVEITSASINKRVLSRRKTDLLTGDAPQVSEQKGRTILNRSVNLFTRSSNAASNSLDSEGLFVLEGMEDSIVNEPGHSEGDSDTDHDGGAHVLTYADETLVIAEDWSVPEERFGPLRAVLHDSGSHDEGIDVHRKRTSSIQLAKSLPVNVPVYSVPSTDFEKDEESLDAVDIAASIKALARSVHGDAVFGDLPRPRFSTQI